MKSLLIFMLLSSLPSIVFADVSPIKPIHLTLSQAMALASKQNPQVVAANERVHQTWTSIAASRASLNPQISGTFWGQRQTRDLRSVGIALPGDPHVGPFNSFDTRAQITLDIFDPAAIKRLQAAKAGEKVSEAESRKVRNDILALVAIMYLDAKRAYHTVHLNQVLYREVKHKHDLARLHIKQGTGNRTELEKAKMDLSEARYLLKSAQAHARATRLDLVAALKLPLDQSIVFEDDSSSMQRSWIGSKDSPDLVFARSQWALSQADEKVAQAGFWPKLTVSADYGRSGASPSASSTTYAYGAAIHVPFWEGGLKNAQLDAARSKTRERRALLSEAQDQNEVRVIQAKDNLIKAQAMLQTKAQQRRYIESQAKVISQRIASGVASQLELDEAQLSEARAIDEHQEAQAAFWSAKINLAHALGRLEELFGNDKNGDV